MPVAVRLVEMITLITILGILAAFSVFLIAAEAIVNTTIGIFMPIADFFSFLLCVMENLCIWLMRRVLELASNVGDSLGLGYGKN